MRPLGPADLAAGRFLRVINFHNTPRRRLAEVERQLAAAAEGCFALAEAELDALLDGGPPLPAPAVIPVLYEGYRNAYDHALGLIERAGLRAWVFVPTAWVDLPAAQQRAYAEAHHLGLTEDEHGDGRYAVSWDELRDVVARGHVVAGHTATHCAASAVRTPQDAERELVEPRRRLEAELGREVRTLAWLHGAAYGEHPAADAAAVAAGYRTLFSGARIQRLPAG